MSLLEQSSLQRLCIPHSEHKIITTFLERYTICLSSFENRCKHNTKRGDKLENLKTVTTHIQPKLSPTMLPIHRKKSNISRFSSHNGSPTTHWKQTKNCVSSMDFHPHFILTKSCFVAFFFSFLFRCCPTSVDFIYFYCVGGDT